MSTLGIAGAVVSLLLGVGGLIFFYFTVMLGAGESYYIVAGASGFLIGLAILIGVKDRPKPNTKRRTNSEDF